jgi:hypothetical protein
MKCIPLDESHNYIKLTPDNALKADAFTLIPLEDGWEEIQYLASQPDIIEEEGI